MLEVAQKYLQLKSGEYYKCFGKVDKVVGLTIESIGPKAKLNDLCMIFLDKERNVKKAEDMLEVKRVALNELMKERKTHEKLRDKKFEDFQKEEKDNESKEIDQLVSFTYNS